MDTFANVLKELMRENSLTVNSFAKQLGLADPAIIYKWLRGENQFLLPTALKIADYFQCSLDYLFGRSDDFGKGNFVECLPFDVQFRKVLEEQKISQYQLLKDKVVSGGNIDHWLNKKQNPHITSIIKLADYLEVTLDYLVGRES